MCGIIGGINLPAKVGQDFITQALYVDALRGWDSTGLVAIRKGRAEYYKRAIGAADFIRTRAFQRLVSGEAEAFIGHNRAATVGSVNDETAHPFVHGHIIGVHNGTLDWGWRKELKDGDKFAVDSDALIHNIAHEGIKETVAKAEGAFAIVYYDMKERTLNIIRNKERPMFYGLLNYKGEDKWIYGSEAGLLEWIAERTDSGDPPKEIWELKEGHLLSFDLVKAGSAPAVEKMTVAGRSAYNNGPFRGGQYSSNNWNTTKGNTVVGATTRPKVTMMPHERNIFKRQNIDPNESVEFWPTTWTAFGGNSKQGVLRGAMCDAPYIEVLVYNVTESEVNMNKIYEAFPVTIRLKPHVKDKHKTFDKMDAGELEMVLSATTLRVVDEFGEDIIVEQESDDKPFQKALPNYSSSKFLGPKGNILSRVEFDDLTRNGCSCCSDNIIYGVDRVYWTVDSQPLCEQCHVDLNLEVADVPY